MRDIEPHSHPPLNRMDHKKWVDHNKDTDEEISEQFVLLISSTNDPYSFRSYKALIL